jgi:hypothetical protein
MRIESPKRAASALALALAVAAAWAQGAAAPLKLDADEAARLASGEAVIREVKDSRSLSLTASGELADKLRSRVASIRPNYLSEVMFALPSREGAIEDLASAVANVKDYVGIQYWSKRQKTNYNLFDRLDIVSRVAIAGGEQIEVLQHMEPFADFGCRYSYRSSAAPSGRGREFFFECENTSPISYSGLNAVSPGRMAWLIYAFPSDGKVIFYGVGAVRAFDMFGAIRERLEVSFLGRVEAFFGHMSKKLGG